MISSLIPKYSFRRFTDVTPGFLQELGVSFLMLDLDNTVAKYAERLPNESVRLWVSDMVRNGIGLFFVSNSRRSIRVDTFSGALGIGFIKHARKPSTDGLLRAMEIAGCPAGGSALLGDQIFTDTLAANRAGVISMIVRPLSLKNPFRFLRFAAETPFRAASRGRQGSGIRDQETRDTND